MDKPLVSVIIPYFNAESTILEAIESILDQTYNNLEIILINDGSTDNSYPIVKSLSDRRLVLLNNEINQGISTALNKGIRIAKGDFIARMDADDVSLNNRIQIQLNYLNANPLIDGCGAFVRLENGSIWKYPLNSVGIKNRLFFGSAMAHPTWFFRANVLKSSPYNPKFDGLEDWELLIRLSNGGYKLSNIPELLLNYTYKPMDKKINDDFVSQIKDVFEENLPKITEVLTESQLDYFIQLNINNRKYNYPSCFKMRVIWLKLLDRTEFINGNRLELSQNIQLKKRDLYKIYKENHRWSDALLLKIDLWLKSRQIHT